MASRENHLRGASVLQCIQRPVERAGGTKLCPPATFGERNLLIINNGRAQVNFTKGSKGRKGAAVLDRRGKGSAFLEKTTHELQDETIFIIFAELNRFFRACEIPAFSEKKRAQYEQNMYDERRFQGQLAASYKNGLEAGIAEGREEGREAERLEGQKRLIASAKKMVASGVDIDLVCSTLGVDKAEVLKN